MSCRETEIKIGSTGLERCHAEERTGVDWGGGSMGCQDRWKGMIVGNPCKRENVNRRRRKIFFVKLVYVYIRINIFTPCISVADMYSCMLRVLFDWNTVSVWYWLLIMCSRSSKREPFKRNSLFCSASITDSESWKVIIKFLCVIEMKKINGSD